MATVDLSDMCVVCYDGEGEPGIGGPKEYVRTAVRNGNRYKEYRCVDRKGCARREAAERRLAVADCLAEVREARDLRESARQDLKHAEADVAVKVRFALAEGAGATAIARAAGLSRERIYQIRDDRR